MNISLVYPTSKNWESWPPLGLAYIAAFLQKNSLNVNLQIIDRNVLWRDCRGNYKNVDFKTIDLMKKNKPDIVGISATTPLIKDAYHIAQLVKSHTPAALTVLGGIHASALPQIVLKECPHIDLVCVGEGEKSLNELASNKKNISQIKGFVFRSNSKAIYNQAQPLIENLDFLPFPARNLLDMGKYTEKSDTVIRGTYLHATHLFGARGCPYHCKFCASSFVFNNKVRFHSPKYLVDEIKHLVNTYHLEALYFAEDMFLSDEKRAKEFCELFVREGIHKKIRWCALLRTDVINETLLNMLRDSGCFQVEYGFESGSDKVLKLMNKKTSVALNYKAAVLTKKSNLRFLASIVVGIPGETKKDFSETISFIRKIKADFVGFNKFIPIPGSDFYCQLEKEEKINNDWQSYWSTNLDYNFSEIPNRLFIFLFFYYYLIFNSKNKLLYYIYVVKTKNLSLTREASTLFYRITDLFKRFLKNITG